MEKRSNIRSVMMLLWAIALTAVWASVTSRPSMADEPVEFAIFKLEQTINGHQYCGSVAKSDIIGTGVVGGVPVCVNFTESETANAASIERVPLIVCSPDGTSLPASTELDFWFNGTATHYGEYGVAQSHAQGSTTQHWINIDNTFMHPGQCTEQGVTEDIGASWTKTYEDLSVWYRVYSNDKSYCGDESVSYSGTFCLNTQSEPGPTPTATPPVTPTPVSERGLLAVPDGCDGVEVFPFSWGLVNPGNSWSADQYHGYTDYTVRWTFRAAVGMTQAAQAKVNGFQMGLNWSGPSSGEDMYYEVTWPSRFTQTTAALWLENTGSNAIMIASICIQPVRTTTQCVNPDPELDQPSQWTVGYPAYINNGAAHLLRGSWIQQQQYLTVGNYRIQFQAQALPSGSSQTFDLYVGSNLYKQVVVPAGDVPTFYYYDFAVSETQTILTLSMGVSAPADAEVRLNYVCLQLLIPSTPTPTPRPTPTPQPPPQSCTNPSYDFSIPDQWTLLSGALIVPESGKTTNILLLYTGSAAYQTLTIPQGQYMVTVKAERGVTSGADAAFAVDFGYQVIGEWVLNSSVPRTEIREYVAVAYLDGGTQQFMISAFLPGVFGGLIHSVCLSFLGNPNPQSTPTPGPTPIPTPPPDPDNCMNPDPGINTLATWVVIGDGYIDGGAAYVGAGAQLAADIPPESKVDYDVVIAGYCTQPSTANIYWRGQMQTFLCAGGGLPFNRTFRFSADSLLFISSPLVELLMPELGDGSRALPSDLPEGFAPQLLRSPLSLPLPPEQDINDPFYSPLEVPLFPEEDAVDAMMLMLSSIMQIQASTANTGQIVVTSVCVRDLGWTPPAEPPAINLYYPLCERDWSVKRDYSVLHPALLVGIGARAGMPVHAMGPGTVVSFGANVTYMFGGVNYDGCVVIDHTGLGINLQSVTCNLNTFTISEGGTVSRGALLGYTGERTYYGLFVSTGVGLATVATNIDGSWVNPTTYFSGYTDCRPYQVIIAPVDSCAADDGSNAIPPRYNSPAPSLWNPEEWVPWLAHRLYDVVGYPILCALVPFFNTVTTLIQNAVNVMLTVLGEPLMFLYRVSRVFQYMIAVFGRVLAAFMSMFAELADMGICFRSIVVYFIAAMTAASSAQTTPLDVGGGPLAYGMSLAMMLISSTVANIILVPIVGLFIAYASWQIVPWGIRKLRQAVGLD